MKSENEKDNDIVNKKDNVINVGISGASYEIIDKYGSAAKEHLVAYSGKDYETGKNLTKSLKSIHNQKSNSEYEFQINQQKAGWAAEVKETAKTNAEYIIDGNKNRKMRLDDYPNTPANNPLYDHVEIDANGNIISGSETQMKFIGESANDPLGTGNAERALKKLQSKDFEKYLDNDVKIEVPKDEYQKIIDQASDEISNLEKQLKKVKESGNLEAAEKIERKIEKLNKLKKNLRPSKVSRKESVEASQSPEISTVKSIINISHRAGVKTAENALVIGGSVSLVKNIVELCKGNIDSSEASVNIVKDTSESAIVGYTTGFVGTSIKSLMQNSSSEMTRTLAKTNIAGTIVSFTVSASKVLKQYFKGEINGVECLESLGEQGTGMMSSAIFAVIGQTAIPIPVVGGLIGGMVGYSLSSATYGILVSSLKEKKLTHEERIQIEKECEEHIKMVREYREQMNKIIEEYLVDKMNIFEDSFSGIKDALSIGDIDMFIENANIITEAVGGNKQFENFDDFDQKMLSKTTFKL